MNANANKAPFKQSPAAPSPSLYLSLQGNESLAPRRRGRRPAAGWSLHSLSAEIWKRGETLMMSWGFHRGKWKDSKGNWEHCFLLPLFLVAVIKHGMKERGRESRFEVSHKAQAGAFCSNYRQIGDLDISARWSISWWFACLFSPLSVEECSC